MQAPAPHPEPVTSGAVPSSARFARRWPWVAAATAATLGALWLAGCAVEVENLKPAQEIAARAKPPGSVYVGWRVFQDKCARCHGPAALGTAQAPNLLPRLREMGSRQFVGLVLQRYDWNQPAGSPRPEGAERDALVDSMLLRKAQPLAMPAWQGEPAVNAHITDLYAYLSARAQGTQGPERPAP